MRLKLLRGLFLLHHQNIIKLSMITKLKSGQFKFTFPLVPILFFYANFFNGIYQPILNKFDWYIYNTETEVYRSAFSNFNFPGYLHYVLPNSSALTNIGSYYPSFPYGIRTPDVFLLPFIGNLSFIYIHITWVVALGLYGIYKISKDIGTSYFTYVILSITWFLSGPLVARMGIGHTPLFGYFLIPLFFYLLFKLNSPLINWINILNMGVFLFLISLLGSTIVFTQMCLIIVINAFIKIKYFYYYIISILVGLVLSSYIILPSLFHSKYINAPNRTVFEGYGWNFPNSLTLKNAISNFTPTFENIMDILKLLLCHLVNIFQQLLIAVSSQTAVLKDGGWEWTLYSGIVYVPILVLMALFARRINFSLFYTKSDNSLVIKICLIISVLSLSLVYRFIFKLLNIVINFPAIDRIPYRMMIYVLFISYLYLFKNLDLVMRKISNLKFNFMLKVLLLILQIYSLSVNANYWTLSNIFNTFQKFDQKVGLSENVFSNVINISGTTLDTYIGYCISIASIILLTGIYSILLPRYKRNQNSLSTNNK